MRYSYLARFVFNGIDFSDVYLLVRVLKWL